MNKDIIILFLLLSNLMVGQNLVPNPSFEDTVACPSGVNEMNKADGWYSLFASPDYYHTCASFPVSVPSSTLGFQNPATGNAYAGFFNQEVFGLREMIGSQLISALSIGQTYFVSFKVSLADDTINTISCGTNKMGIIFSMDSIYYFNANFADVYSDSIITDMDNWTTIYGSFTADSAYTRIVIGNFFDDVNTDSIMISGAFPSCRSYYYIDDICISNDSLTCYVPTGVKSNNQKSIISIYPNPTSTHFTIEGLNKPYNLNIYNALGQLLYTENNVLETSKIVDVSKYIKGLIFIRIESDGEIYYHKIIKN